MEERKLPSTGKVMKAKVFKLLEQAWELHEHEDIDLMKKYLLHKMEEENCDALDLAAVLLKYQVGDRGQEIAVDEAESRRFGKRKGAGEDRRKGAQRGRDRDAARRDQGRNGRRGKNGITGPFRRPRFGAAGKQEASRRHFLRETPGGGCNFRPFPVYYRCQYPAARPCGGRNQESEERL